MHKFTKSLDLKINVNQSPNIQFFWTCNFFCLTTASWGVLIFSNKSFVCHSSQLWILQIQLIFDEIDKIGAPPELVVTQCGSWIKAGQYNAKKLLLCVKSIEILRIWVNLSKMQKWVFMFRILLDLALIEQNYSEISTIIPKNWI